MKRRVLFSLFIIGLAIITNGFSYNYEPYQSGNTVYSPILISYDDLSKSIENQPSREIANASKLTIYQTYILIVEKYKGVHIFDNSNLGFPQPVGFIQILGCSDIAIKDGILYADNSVDLVSINLKNYPEIIVNNRIKNAFPEPLPPDLGYVPTKFRENNRPKNSIIIEWIKD